jgi:hypothetical protein
LALLPWFCFTASVPSDEEWLLVLCNFLYTEFSKYYIVTHMAAKRMAVNTKNKASRSRKTKKRLDKKHAMLNSRKKK